MQPLATQLIEELGIDQGTAEKVADYLSRNWARISGEMMTEETPSLSEQDESVVVDDPTPEGEPAATGRADDDRSWVLHSADSC
jgi:hypothetical protein